MPLRTQVNKVDHIENADDLERVVSDKRMAKRAKSRKNRRNRHYVKTMLRNIKQAHTNPEDMDE